MNRYRDEHLMSLVIGSLPCVRMLVRTFKRAIGKDRPLLKRRPGEG